MDMDFHLSNMSLDYLEYHFNSTETLYPLDLEQNIDTQGIVITSVLLYIGLCTNIWMLWSLYKTWEAGSRAHFYLLAFCISDILGLCIRCSIDIGVTATVYWRTGNIGCKIFMAIYFFGAYLNHFILAAFNVDNVISLICKRVIGSLRKILLLISLCLAVFVCVPEFFQFSEETTSDLTQTFTFCVQDYWPPLVIISMVAIYGFPLFIMLFCGGPSLCLWCGTKGELRYNKMNDDGSNADFKNIGKDTGMTITYNVLFIICWTPWAFVNSYVWLNSSMWTYFMFRLASFISIANSCLNPFIYGIFTCINKRQGKVSPGL